MISKFSYFTTSKFYAGRWSCLTWRFRLRRCSGFLGRCVAGAGIPAPAPLTWICLTQGADCVIRRDRRSGGRCGSVCVRLCGLRSVVKSTSPTAGSSSTCMAGNTSAPTRLRRINLDRCSYLARTNIAHEMVSPLERVRIIGRRKIWTAFSPGHLQTFSADPAPFKPIGILLEIRFGDEHWPPHLSVSGSLCGFHEYGIDLPATGRRRVPRFGDIRIGVYGWKRIADCHGAVLPAHIRSLAVLLEHLYIAYRRVRKRGNMGMAFARSVLDSRPGSLRGQSRNRYYIECPPHPRLWNLKIRFRRNGPPYQKWPVAALAIPRRV